MKNCLAIITARGGSKRIPRKNIKNFLGKPIINYSIQSAIDCSCFDEVIVSTDDQEIAEVAIAAGAKIPFIRSAESSNDFSTTAEVISEVLRDYKKIGVEFEYVCCIYPTAPFITADKLKNAYEMLISSGAKSVVPVVRFGFPIQRSFKIEDNSLRMNWPEHMSTRSQDLPASYHDSGQFYFLRTESFLKDNKLFTDFTVPYEMPESEVQDIDNEEDWKLAEIKYTFLLSKQKNR
ncbi:pseudaminic acid cytidylyltransferase [Flavobacterium urumqiense]|uniref:N-acylneuraminate cytidylyltransferase n=1 Tax=Flavobacterium urumqiense TaxID=935224 RepID=A0A1H5Y387_9FLAO|nr:pseudaminic acid cytidylyltransferase [Flavobacterium urumqiense]SEG18016.1 N-acylneuraminate cytidylyltransferase [Flavobacterium urumqiense]